VVNKADGDQKMLANRVRGDYAAALRMLHPTHTQWQPTALTCSALANEGIAEVWHKVGEFTRIMHDCGAFQENRAQQAKAWMWKEIRETVLARFLSNPKVAAQLDTLEQRVARSELSPTAAAHLLVQQWENA
ncbi:MAG: hypothetical protein K2Q01_06550, partial [Rickettsiales bacterium]|nr:hypothetical protein [Rickettsiales bacterium]